MSMPRRQAASRRSRRRLWPAQDAEAGSEALLGMRLGPHDRLAQRHRGRADLLGGGEQARRRPEGVPTVRTRHVLGDRRVPSLQRRAGMAGDPHAAMEHLDGRAGACAPRPPGGSAGTAPSRSARGPRRGSPAPPGAPPFGVLIGLVRQRHQGRPIDGLEELPAAGAELAHQAGIEFIDQRADRRVQLGEREEAPVAQPRQDPALDDQHRRPRPWPCRAACAAASAGWWCRNGRRDPGRSG